jgi:tripeptide aminopeptidase
MPCTPTPTLFLSRRLPVALAALMLAGAAAAQTFTPGPIAAVVEQTHARLLAAPSVRKVLDDVKADDARALGDLRAMTEIAAPPFKEKARAEFFLARLKALGLANAAMDAEGNVVGIRKGTGNSPKLVISAHLDTVFPEGTDVTVKEREGRLYAPGISDDTRGLAVLLSWLKVLNDNQLQTVGDLVFVGNVGEEELGNLRGMKALFKEHADIDGLVGLEPGEGNGIIMQGTGSHRYEVSFRGPGGHSFGAFGLPSAIHAMGRAIARIDEVRTPENPKTTFTVGTVSGGTSVNAIAGDARMAVDIRSNANSTLLEAERQIMAAISEGVADENRRWNSDKISYQTRLIGDRPAGLTPADSRIVQVAVRSITGAGKTPTLFGASTDANVPMSLGIPAIILGSGGKTGGFHARDEWFDPRGAWEGAQLSLTTVLGLVGVQGVSEPLLDRRAARTPQ